MKWAPQSLFSSRAAAWGACLMRFLTLFRSFPLQMNAR